MQRASPPWHSQYARCVGGRSLNHYHTCPLHTITQPLSYKLKDIGMDADKLSAFHPVTVSTVPISDNSKLGEARSFSGGLLFLSAAA